MRPRRAIDMTGQRFGKLAVIGQDGVRGTDAVWLCQCDCGNTKVVRVASLRRGATQSCGCVQKSTGMTHGLSKHPLYRTWSNVMARCYDPNSIQYNDYGGRGIQVCERWHDLLSFIADMPPHPGPEFSIDRIDVNGHYEPGNVRWATRKEQMSNRRASRYVTHNGETKTLSEWSETLGVRPYLIGQRIRQGWTAKEAIETPVLKGRQKRCS